MKSMLMIFSMVLLRCCWGPTDYQILLEQQNDDTLLKKLNGEYQINTINYEDVSAYNLNIVFNDSTNQVSGFAGCNRFFGSYSLDKNALSFNAIGATKMMCKEDANKIETKLLKAFEKANIIFFEKEGFTLYDNKKRILSTTKAKTNDSVSFEYSAMSRGTYKVININKKSVSVISKPQGEPNIVTCNESDWNKINKILKNVDVKKIQHLKAPSEKRIFDGAAIGNLKITYNNKLYETQSFDHGNPPKEIADLVKEILSIAENIE